MIMSYPVHWTCQEAAIKVGHQTLQLAHKLLMTQETQMGASQCFLFQLF
jgi:hypothetical protein